MPRTALTIQNPPGAYPTLPMGAGSAAFTFAAADVGNGNSFISTGREMVLVNNTGGAPFTVTFTSVADNLKRTGDITTYSVTNATFAWFGPFSQAGWLQSDGTVWVNGSNAGITIAVCRLPSAP